jgi:hypothetical protein
VRYCADENIGVDLAPALGFDGPGVKACRDQLYRGLSGVADSNDFAVTCNPVAAASGLNHLAFHAGSQKDVDTLVVEGALHGWMQLFQDKYPYAGGPDHYAAYLFNSDGFEIELVAAG